MMCPICREEGSDFITRCKHEFHFGCVSDFIKQHKSCPYCRGPVTTIQIIEKMIISIKGNPEGVQSLDLDSLKKLFAYLPFLELFHFKLLIQRSKELKCNFHESKFLGKPILHFIVENKKVEFIKEVIEAGCNIDAIDKNGFTALAIACKKGNLTMIKELISYGAEFTSSLNDYLFEAVKIGNYQVIKYFAEIRPESIFSLDKNGRTLLHDTLYDSHLFILKYLIRLGIDFNKRDKYGDTILHDACRSQYGSYFIPYLLKLGMDVNEKNNGGLSPLEIACENSYNIKDVKMLIKHGAHLKPDILFLAIENEFICRRLVPYLLKFKIDLNYKNWDGETVLMRAVENKETDIVKCLLENGADPTIESPYAETVLHIAIRLGFDKIVENTIKASGHIFLQDGKAQLSSAIHYSYERKNFAILLKLVQFGAPIDCRSEIGKTILHLAAEDGELELLKQLIKMGADVNAMDHKGFLPRDYAKNKEVINYLIENGAPKYHRTIRLITSCYS